MKRVDKVILRVTLEGMETRVLEIRDLIQEAIHELQELAEEG